MVTLWELCLSYLSIARGKKPPQKQLSGTSSQISTPDTEPTETHSQLIEPINSKTSPFVVTGGLVTFRVQSELRKSTGLLPDTRGRIGNV
jgi:hypothetical protein